MRRGSEYPATVEVSDFGNDLEAWVATNSGHIDETLHRVGAVLFKRTPIRTAAALERFVRRTSAEIPQFKEESSPRSQVEGSVYTSTDYPREYSIQFHNEYSYAQEWPMKLYFACFRPPDTSGETPIADTRKVLASLRPSTRAAFERHGVQYVRSYRPKIGVSWQRAFSTERPEVVEQICAERGIQCEWRPGGVLRTRQVGEAILPHPITQELVWFNHAFFFNVRAIEPASLREVLMDRPEDDPLSTNTLFGNSEPIGTDIIEELRSSYAEASASTKWELGDVLLIDNMLSAHARAPFTGQREIVVVMADVGRMASKSNIS